MSFILIKSPTKKIEATIKMFSLNYIKNLLTLLFIISWLIVGAEGFRNMYVREEFEDFKGDRLVLFWAEWCPHCRTIKSKENEEEPKQWDILEQRGGVQTSKGKIPAINYEIDEAPELFEKFEVKSFPTVMLIRSDGSTQVQKEGARTVKGWEEFVRKMV